MLRKWLRRLMGWDTFELFARVQREHYRALEKRVDAAEEQITTQAAELARLTAKRDRVGQARPVVDWETAQAAFLGDPKNFEGKEN